MRTSKLLALIVTALLLNGSIALAGQPCTAFTYQGRLFDGGSPANGLYDLQFTNYAAAIGGNALGGVNADAVPVSNGLFTVTLDFGAVFDGSMRWLELSERTNGAGSFVTLSPRQPLAAAPYAVFAATEALPAHWPAWPLQQNSDGAPNVIGGSAWNFVGAGVEGATIGGGGATNFLASAFWSGSALTNSVLGSFGTVSGGEGNTAGYSATVAGGGGNNASGTEATVSGGALNSATNWYATVGGGETNIASGYSATVGGGYGNTASGNEATVGGGQNNSAGSDEGDGGRRPGQQRQRFQRDGQRRRNERGRRLLFHRGRGTQQ